jgi:hypothetical protein
LPIIEGRKELFDNGTGSLRNDLQCDKISSVLARKTVYIPCISFGSSVPGFEGLVDREIGSVDITSTGI